MRTPSAVRRNSQLSQTQEMLNDDDALEFSKDVDNHYAIKQKLFDENVKCGTQEIAAIRKHQACSTTMMPLSCPRRLCLVP